METFAKLFGNLLVFVYHCFDRIVINGYLNGLSRPEQVVHFVREVLGIPVVSKEVLSRRTNDYQNWVEAFAHNHKIPIEWAGKSVRKEAYVLPALQRMVKKNESLALLRHHADRVLPICSREQIGNYVPATIMWRWCRRAGFGAGAPGESATFARRMCSQRGQPCQERL